MNGPFIPRRRLVIAFVAAESWSLPISVGMLSKYGPMEQPPKAGHTDSVSEHTTTTFLPSKHGLAFDNSWPAGPAVSIPLGIGVLGIGNAGRGLCGGMVFAALDFWHAGAAPPADRPKAGTPLFRFIVRRLVDSWHVPTGVARYYRWMRLPDEDRRATSHRRAGARRASPGRRTIEEHWPAVQALLDAGVPAALGVVTVASANPLLLGANHQVLAYEYETADSVVLLHVYDPNVGPDDSVRIRFDLAAEPATFAHNLGLQRPVRGFFLTRYKPAYPPGQTGASGLRSQRLRGRRAAGTPSG
jgi:hypothetical protein